ncbi:hypothetical protein HGRIS_013001 [Hohenbuehelia grisea]|uniref:NAD(P)-binding protein n=1 Tax=Hohenbuehelia grisea TaxID=104357 RepID=A0ABR3IU56_9AGAR
MPLLATRSFPSISRNFSPARSLCARRWNSSNLGRPAKMALPSFSLQGKTCLVTGAARGLGLEFCRAFLQSGCTSLAVLDLKESEAQRAADELISEASSVYPEGTPKDLNIIGVGCDVASEESLKRAFGTVNSTFGRLDAAVASAGVVGTYSAMDYPTDRLHQLFDINVHGAFYTAREAARMMIPQGGGSIVLVASMSATIVNIPQPQTPYNASKAAVKHMASSLGVEWAKTGVRVNALSPGYMLTKLTKGVLDLDDELKQTWERLTPMGRVGDPDDLSGAIVYLCSDASKFMTGAELRVDGGYCVV